MLPIARRLIRQRLSEVDAEMTRVMELKPRTNRDLSHRVWMKDMEMLKSIRREVLRELGVLDTL